jgi:ferritin-like metal-binding protein YciE
MKPFRRQNLQNIADRQRSMARDRTVRKVEKVMKRVEKHIEETRDALEDLEIEFEVLKATVKRLRNAAVEEAPVEVEDDEPDIENSTNTTAMRKF